MNLSTLSTKELISLYNQHAAKPVKKFSSRAIALKRTAAIIPPVQSKLKSNRQTVAERSPSSATVWVRKVGATSVCIRRSLLLNSMKRNVGHFEFN